MSKGGRKLDILGTTTSLLCAVHCALLPIILSWGLIGTHSIMSHPAVEITVMTATAIFVCFSIWIPYMKYRHNLVPFGLSLLGFILVLTHHMFTDYTTLIVVIGGIMIAAAHLTNLVIGTHSHKNQRI